MAGSGRVKEKEVRPDMAHTLTSECSRLRLCMMLRKGSKKVQGRGVVYCGHVASGQKQSTDLSDTQKICKEVRLSVRSAQIRV